MFHDANGVYAGTDEPYLFGRLRVSGRDPEHRSYRSFASFHDPDGHGWLFQPKLPMGSTRSAWAGSATKLARMLRRVHDRGAGRDGAADVSGNDIIFVKGGA